MQTPITTPKRRLRSYRDVIRDIKYGSRSRRMDRKALKEEESYDISDVKLVTLGNDVSASERELLIDRFSKDIGSMNAGGLNIILTAISFE